MFRVMSEWSLAAEIKERKRRGPLNIKTNQNHEDSNVKFHSNLNTQISIKHKIIRKRRDTEGEKK